MFIATQYASLSISIIQDWLRLEPALRSETFYFLEIGAGTGKFSYFFLKAFEKILKAYKLQDLKYCYIISDVAEKNIEFCQNNPNFKPYIESGKVDFANFDVVKNDSIFLLNKKIDYRELSAKAPLIVVANYIFDCVKIDLFMFSKKDIYEVQLGISSRYKNFNIAESKYLDDLRLESRVNKIDPIGYYEDEILNNLLIEAHKRLGEKELYFSMPIGVFEFLKTLSKITDNRFFIISGDRGLCVEEDLVLTDLKEIMAFNSCFSCLVNFYVLKKFFEKSEGDALLYDGSVSFSVNLFSKGYSFEELSITRNYFNNILKAMGPREYCDFYGMFSAHGYRFTAESLLSFLKTSQYDPNAYACIHNRLLELYSILTPYMIREIELAVMAVRQNIYYSSIEVNVFNLIADFYIKGKAFDTAIEVLKDSLIVFKKNVEAYRTLGKLYEEKKDAEQALYYFEQACHYDPKDKFSKRRMLSLMGKPTFSWAFPLIKTILVCSGIALAFYLLSR